MCNFDLNKLFRCPKYRVVAENDGIKEIYYENEPYLGQPTEVFAYMGVPEGDGPVPAMVCIHGGGGKAFKEWVELWVARGYAAISMDFGGKGPDGEFHAMPGPDQTHVEKFGVDIVWEDIWTYHAVSAIIRAHSILRSLPEVDAERTGMTGISWGGYLTCCTSGIDERFKLAVPVYGCGFLQDNSAEDWLKLFAKMTPEQLKWWHDNCDPSVYLKDSKMPMLFVTGTNDFAYPPDSLRKSCLTPQGKVEACIRLEMEHGHEPGWNPIEIGLYADSILGNGAPLPAIGAVTQNGNTASSTYCSELPVKGCLVYTCESGTWMDRKWHQIDAELANDIVSAELPENVTAYILAVEDERGAYISTLPEILPV